MDWQLIASYFTVKSVTFLTVQINDQDLSTYLRGWSGGAMVLGKLPYIIDDSKQGHITLAVGAGGGCLDIFTLIYLFSPLPLSIRLLVGWLFWAERSFETVFQSISGRLPERRRNKREMIDERKNIQTTPARTYCKRSRPLPYSPPNK